MSLLQRLVWGALAGLAIVLVKIIGPDSALVESFFGPGGDPAKAAFYVFISLVTVLLGLISGAFTNETDRIKLLLFCASVPALLSTATAERREPGSNVANLESPAVFAGQGKSATGSDLFGLVGTAYAQPARGALICEEPGFLKRFAVTGQQYLTGNSKEGFSQHSVIAVMAATLDEAKAAADRIAASPGEWPVFVGCRAPGERGFPVIVGGLMPQLEAAELKGRFDAAKVVPEPSQLSSYPYWTPVYTPRDG